MVILFLSIARSENLRFSSGDARLRAFLENRRFSDQALRPVHLKSEAFLTEVNLHKILQSVLKVLQSRLKIEDFLIRLLTESKP